jgi:hypothetical protein
MFCMYAGVSQMFCMRPGPPIYQVDFVVKASPPHGLRRAWCGSGRCGCTGCAVAGGELVGARALAAIRAPRVHRGRLEHLEVHVNGHHGVTSIRLSAGGKIARLREGAEGMGEDPRSTPRGASSRLLASGGRGDPSGAGTSRYSTAESAYDGAISTPGWGSQRAIARRGNAEPRVQRCWRAMPSCTRAGRRTNDPSTSWLAVWKRPRKAHDRHELFERRVAIIHEVSWLSWRRAGQEHARWQGLPSRAATRRGGLR